MSSVFVEVVSDDDGVSTPLLQNSSRELQHQENTAGGGEITSSLDMPEESNPESVSKKQRLVSVDVFRGLTVALMILVDDAGKSFPAINHSPWFGVTLADFVMPFFLFVVGTSVSLVFKNVPNKAAATKKVVMRSIKLFLLGLILQGGYFHGRDHLTYGVDLDKTRLMGVLQRISVGYFLASILEIWLVNDIVVESASTFLRRYCFQLVVGVLLASIYLVLLYVIYVPNWTFEVSSLSIASMVSGYGSGTETVYCGKRGSLQPPCNAVGFLDRYFLGNRHLYQRPVYRRTKECSVNSPDYGPLPSNAPGWCLAPFDPEGILSSLMATITCFLGLHYGHIILHSKGQMQTLLFWSLTSFPLLISGFVLEVLGVPFSKPLYTLSYMLVTSGASGLLLTIIFYLVDVKCFRKPTILFQWMGMNALIVYALAACDLFPAALEGFYWHSPENNLVDFTERFLQGILHSKKWGNFAFVMLEIIFWGIVSGILHWKRLYIKL